MAAAAEGESLPGISPHTLTSRLRQFEAHGLVTRTVYAEVPPRVEYELTPLGQQLRTVLDAMAKRASGLRSGSRWPGLTI
ncbi:winged helix-turn-helix transcriptional regulator [Leucobacter sp. NPDC015123]|uniref:winged helix-turn-helix transcriptional regulator n=1 Tax=Leucobacter sp. NPDC015123 TaxID=3364129 RepID=UPI0036F4542E